MMGPLRGVTRARFWLGALGGCCCQRSLLAVAPSAASTAPSHAVGLSVLWAGAFALCSRRRAGRALPVLRGRAGVARCRGRSPDGKARAKARLARAAVRQRDGPLTRELLLRPGQFGLGRVPDRLQPDQTTTMVCGFCSTGCGLERAPQGRPGRQPVPDRRLPGEPGHGLSQGLGGADAAARARPRARPRCCATRAGRWSRSAGRPPCETFVERFKDIQAQHGKDSVAWLGTGQIVTEELALLGALGKFGMGMVHGDGNTRQCMATAAVAYKQAFGFDAPPFTYQDFEESDVIVLVGSNLCIAHPIMWERICRNPHEPDDRRDRPAAHRDGDGRHPAHARCDPRRDLTFSDRRRSHPDRSSGWIDREFIDAHTTRLRRVRRPRRRLSRPSGVAGDTGVCGARASSAWPRRFTTASASRSGGRWA